MKNSMRALVVVVALAASLQAIYCYANGGNDPTVKLKLQDHFIFHRGPGI